MPKSSKKKIAKPSSTSLEQNSILKLYKDETPPSFYQEEWAQEYKEQYRPDVSTDGPLFSDLRVPNKTFFGLGTLAMFFARAAGSTLLENSVDIQNSTAISLAPGNSPFTPPASDISMAPHQPAKGESEKEKQQRKNKAELVKEFESLISEPRTIPAFASANFAKTINSYHLRLHDHEDFTTRIGRFLCKIDRMKGTYQVFSDTPEIDQDHLGLLDRVINPILAQNFDLETTEDILKVVLEPTRLFLLTQKLIHSDQRFSHEVEADLRLVRLLDTELLPSETLSAEAIYKQQIYKTELKANGHFVARIREFVIDFDTKLPEPAVYVLSSPVDPARLSTIHNMIRGIIQAHIADHQKKEKKGTAPKVKDTVFAICEGIKSYFSISGEPEVSFDHEKLAKELAMIYPLSENARNASPWQSTVSKERLSGHYYDQFAFKRPLTMKIANCQIAIQYDIVHGTVTPLKPEVTKTAEHLQDLINAYGRAWGILLTGTDSVETITEQVLTTHPAPADKQAWLREKIRHIGGNFISSSNKTLRKYHGREREEFIASIVNFIEEAAKLYHKDAVSSLETERAQFLASFNHTLPHFEKLTYEQQRLYVMEQLITKADVFSTSIGLIRFIFDHTSDIHVDIPDATIIERYPINEQQLKKLKQEVMFIAKEVSKEFNQGISAIAVLTLCTRVRDLIQHHYPEIDAAVFEHEHTVDAILDAYKKERAAQKQAAKAPFPQSLGDYLLLMLGVSTFGGALWLLHKIPQWIRRTPLPPPAPPPVKKEESLEEKEQRLWRQAFQDAEQSKARDSVSFTVPEFLSREALPLIRFTLPREYWDQHADHLKAVKGKFSDHLQTMWAHSLEYQRKEALSNRKKLLLEKIIETGESLSFDSFKALFTDIHDLITKSATNAAFNFANIKDKAAQKAAKDAAIKRDSYLQEITSLQKTVKELTEALQKQVKALLNEWEATKSVIDKALGSYNLEGAEAAITHIEKILSSTSSGGIPEGKQEEKSLSTPHEKKAKLHEHLERLLTMKQTLTDMVTKESDAFTEKTKLLSAAEKAEQERRLGEAKAKEAEAEQKRMQELEKIADALHKRAKSIRELGDRVAKRQQEKEEQPLDKLGKEEVSQHGALPLAPDRITANVHVQRAASSIKKFWELSGLTAKNEAESLVIRNATLLHIGYFFNGLHACSKGIGINEIISILDAGHFRQSTFHLNPLLLNATNEELLDAAKFIKDTFGKAVASLAENGMLPKDQINADYSKCKLLADVRNQFGKAIAAPGEAESIQGIVKGLEDLRQLKGKKVGLFVDSKKSVEILGNLHSDATDMIMARIGEYVSKLHEIHLLQDPKKAKEPSSFEKLPGILQKILSTIRPVLHHPDYEAHKIRHEPDPIENAKVKEKLMDQSAKLLGEVQRNFRLMPVEQREKASAFGRSC